MPHSRGKASQGRPIRRRRSTEPGRILAIYYLEPRGISVTAFATAAGLTRKHISKVVNGHAAITAETAVRFALVLGTTAEFWLNLQTAASLYDARQRQRTEVKADAFKAAS
jgi:addiction module HigA family antidote